MIKDTPCQPGETTASIETANEQLLLLGIPTSWMSFPPSALSYPNSFNKEAREIWLTLFNEEELIEKVRKFTPKKQWLTLTSEFQARCAKQNVKPFASDPSASTNKTLQSFLFNRRYLLVRYLESTRLFDAIRVVLHSDKHWYTQRGDLLVLHASLSFQFKDRPTLVRYLTSRRVRMHRAASVFVRRVAPGTYVRVRDMTLGKATLEWVISLPTPVAVRAGLTAEEKHAWLDNNLFGPMLKQRRMTFLPTRMGF